MAYTAQEIIDIVKSDPIAPFILEYQMYMGFPPELRPTEKMEILYNKINALLLIHNGV